MARGSMKQGQVRKRNDIVRYWLAPGGTLELGLLETLTASGQGLNLDTIVEMENPG